MKEAHEPENVALLRVMKENSDLDGLISLLLRDLRKAPPPPSVNTEYRNGNFGSQMHLLDYWRILRKRLWTIIGITAIITIFVTILVARTPDIYEAQARVEVDLENTDPGLGSAKNNSVVVNNPINYPAYFNTQLKILSGPGLLRRVAKTLDLEHDENFLKYLPKQRQGWRSISSVLGLGNKGNGNSNSQIVEEGLPVDTLSPDASQAELKEAAKLSPYVEALQEGLKVEAVRENSLSIRETYLIDVSFSYPDRQIAAKIVNAIGDVFVLSNLEKKTRTNATTGDFLQKRLVELQTQIRSGEQQLADYAKEHQILSLDASQNTVVERLAGLNKQLLEAENERKSAEAAYRASLAPGAAQALAEDALNKNNDRQITEIEIKLVELRQRRAQLLSETTEEWPEVKEINTQIDTLEKQVQQARSRAASLVVANLETHYKESLAREQSLRSAFDEQRARTLTQNDAAINYHILEQEIQTNKDLLNGLLQRSKENDVILAGTPNNISVVDYAIAPRKPVGPKRLLIIALTGVLSLCFGIGLALLLEYLDNTVRSSDDVERILGLPAIALIPSVDSLRGRKLLSSRSRDDNATSNPELLMNLDTRSPLNEAYRQLRTSVLLASAGHPPRTLLITSSIPAEGKTTTSVNTALSLAQINSDVLIVDADMRRPRLQSIFKIDNNVGLSSILSSNMSEAEMLNVIKHHDKSGLYLLPSGPIPPNPAELIGSEQMRRFIRVAERTFSHIVIDSPPIVSFTDGVLLSSMVDGVLLVVHSGKGSRHVVRRSQQLLREVGAKIIGVVLNNVNLRAQPDYYSESYYAYYKSGNGSLPYPTQTD